MWKQRARPVQTKPGNFKRRLYSFCCRWINSARCAENPRQASTLARSPARAARWVDYGSFQRYDMGFVEVWTIEIAIKLKRQSDISYRFRDNWKALSSCNSVVIGSVLDSFFQLFGTYRSERNRERDRKRKTVERRFQTFSSRFLFSSASFLHVVGSDLFHNFAKLRNVDRFHEPLRGRG